MSKKLLRCLCFSFLFIFLACAPKPKIAPPPLYEEREHTLEEILEKAGNDIQVIKAIVAINIEKDNKPYSYINASILIKRPVWVHMRMYQLGMLVRDFVIKDDELYVLSGKRDGNLKELGEELYNSIFWWDVYSSGNLYRDETEYIIATEDKIIHLDRTTLLPVRQDIKTANNKILIMYNEPKNNDGFWYPSLFKIYVDDFTFTVRLKKLIKNPSLGEFDFQIPAGS